ncbi:hypothetical protein BDR04DRAFT_1088650 [Suillus decipiens]|nr:hypothetical protein BDR04DRAFT_1088650 [Suillus decipiens]
MYLFFPSGCILGLIHPAFFIPRIYGLWNCSRSLADRIPMHSLHFEFDIDLDASVRPLA